MKIICYIAIFAITTVGAVYAQTNVATEAAANTNVNATASTNLDTNKVSQILALVSTNTPPAKPRSESETLIEADGPADFNLAGHKVVYHDNVRVSARNMKLRCEWLAADLPEGGGRVTNIVAKTNVVIDATDDKGQKMHATADKAVYVYNVKDGVTNETVTLTGNARLENKQGWLTGDSIVWDRIHDSLSVPSNPKMVFHQSLNVSPKASSMDVGTNAANAPKAGVTETNLPMTETNLPVVQSNSLPVTTNQTSKQQ